MLQEQRLSEAESTFRKVIVIFEQAYGSSHEKTMGAHNNLALVLHDAGVMERPKPCDSFTAVLFCNHRCNEREALLR